MISSLVQGIHESIEVHSFWEPEEALEWCSAHGPELVLLDYRMPSMDGITFTQRLKGSTLGARTAVVMVTAQEDTALRNAALEAGVVAYVRKPIAAIELKHMIRNLLGVIATQRGLGSEADGSGPETMTHPNADLTALGRLMEVSRLNHPWMTHSVLSVDGVAAGIAKQLMLDDRAVEETRTAARVFDMGLVMMPIGIMMKNDPLSLSDRNVIQTHVTLTREILIGLAPAIADIAYHARERFNGSGYPDGLIGEAIPLPSRILSVASALCSMISPRPHRDAFRISEAMDDIQKRSNTWYDPKCVAALVDSLPDAMNNASSLPSRQNSSLVGGVR